MWSEFGLKKEEELLLGLLISGVIVSPLLTLLNVFICSSIWVTLILGVVWALCLTGSFMVLYSSRKKEQKEGRRPPGPVLFRKIFSPNDCVKPEKEGEGASRGRLLFEDKKEFISRSKDIDRVKAYLILISGIGGVFLFIGFAILHYITTPAPERFWTDLYLAAAFFFPVFILPAIFLGVISLRASNPPPLGIYEHGIRLSKAGRNFYRFKDIYQTFEEYDTMWKVNKLQIMFKDGQSFFITPKPYGFFPTERYDRVKEIIYFRLRKL